MKTKPTLEQIVELSAKKVLYLSNHELINGWGYQFNTEEEIEKVLNIYREKGLRHSSLMHFQTKCRLENLIAVLDEIGKLRMIKLENDHWDVCFDKKREVFPNASDSFIIVSEELFDVLWKIVIAIF